MERCLENVHVPVLGEEVIRYRSGHHTRTKRIEVYKSDQFLEEAKNYTPGYRKQYDFQFTVPSAGEVGSTKSSDNLLMKGLELFSGRGPGRLEWNVKGHLDAKGIDIRGRQKIHVNLH